MWPWLRGSIRNLLPRPGNWCSWVAVFCLRLQTTLLPTNTGRRPVRSSTCVSIRRQPLVLHEPWRRITQVPVDPSTRTLWTKADDEDIARSGSELGQYLKKYDQSLPMWDEIAAGVWLDPSLIRHQMTVLVDIDTSFTAGYGNTLSWPQGKGPGLGERGVDVVTDVDVPGLMSQVKTLLKKGR